jgi:hypothetical protein
MKEFNYLVSGTAPELYPAHLFFGLLWVGEDDSVEIPMRYPFQGPWGEPISNRLMEREQFPAPFLLDMVWLSPVEQVFYSLYERLPVEILEDLLSETDEKTGQPICSHLVVGMAPSGIVALWAYGLKKSTLVRCWRGEPVHVEMSDFLPMNPDMPLEEFCSDTLRNLPEVQENQEQNGFPPVDLYENYMRQYRYRYQVLFGKWDEEEETWTEYGEEEAVPELDSLKEALFDGSFDKTNDGRLMAYHEAGKPQKLALEWHVRKWVYEAYFWFLDEGIRAGFDSVCGEEPDQETDLIVRIDPSQDKVEVSLNREGMEEPYVLPEEAYELIIFRNRLESFRSENYGQGTGAWIW